MENKGFLLCRYGHFSGINRKVQMKYQPKGRPRGSSSDDGKDFIVEQFIFFTAASAAAVTTTSSSSSSNNKRAVSIMIAFLHLCIEVSKISQSCCEWLHISKHGSVTNDVTSPCSF